MIEFQGLAKWFGTCEAVKPLTLTVPRGAIFGLLGPKSAGKTTTIRMMMGILVPSAGRVLVEGYDSNVDAARIRRRVGYVPSAPVFYDFLRGREILRGVAELHSLRKHEALARCDRLLAELDLGDAADRLALDFTPSMRKRLGLACALMHQPSVLVLDEPLEGLDLPGLHAVSERLLAEAARGTTVFFSTRSVADAQRLCDQAALLDRGSLLAAGTIAQIRATAAGSDALAGAAL